MKILGNGTVELNGQAVDTSGIWRAVFSEILQHPGTIHDVHVAPEDSPLLASRIAYGGNSVPVPRELAQFALGLRVELDGIQN